MAIQFIDLKTQYAALKEDIQTRINKVLESGAFINGPEVAELEKKLAEHTGAKYALACASGTDALLMPMMGLGIGAGAPGGQNGQHEVITTAFSFIATAETIVLAGAKPVFCDIDPKTFNIDVSKIEALITPKTKAIMPVSLYGQVTDMDEINAIAKKHGLHVIEDLAQSYGAKYKGKRSGSLSIAAGTSFYPAKPLGCYGDGGAVFTNDDNLYKAMKEIREHGSESRYFHTRLGINGRLDTIQCTVLLSKLTRYDWEVEQRQKIANYFNSQLSQIKVAGFSTPFVEADRDSVWAQYTLMVPDRPLFQKKMQELGVPTVVHYPRIMPEQPWYKEHLAPKGTWTHSQKAADHVISLPMYPDMDRATQDKIIDSVIKVMS